MKIRWKIGEIVKTYRQSKIEHCTEKRWLGHELMYCNAKELYAEHCKGASKNR